MFCLISVAKTIGNLISIQDFLRNVPFESVLVQRPVRIDAEWISKQRKNSVSSAALFHVFEEFKGNESRYHKIVLDYERNSLSRKDNLERLQGNIYTMEHSLNLLEGEISKLDVAVKLNERLFRPMLNELKTTYAEYRLKYSETVRNLEFVMRQAQDASFESDKRKYEDELRKKQNTPEFMITNDVLVDPQRNYEQSVLVRSEMFLGRTDYRILYRTCQHLASFVSSGLMWAPGIARAATIIKAMLIVCMISFAAAGRLLSHPKAEHVIFIMQLGIIVQFTDAAMFEFAGFYLGDRESLGRHWLGIVGFTLVCYCIWFSVHSVSRIRNWYLAAYAAILPVRQPNRPFAVSMVRWIAGWIFCLVWVLYVSL